MNSDTKSKKVWDMIRKISGKNNSQPYQHITHKGTRITNEKDIAEHLAENFAKNSSSNNPEKKKKNSKQSKSMRRKKKLIFAQITPKPITNHSC